MNAPTPITLPSLTTTEGTHVALAIPATLDAQAEHVTADGIALACVAMLRAERDGAVSGVWCGPAGWQAAAVTRAAMAAVRAALDDPRVLALARWRARARGEEGLLEMENADAP
jgi:hypothetical protein